VPEPLRVLTWNLFHGRTVPESGRLALPEFSRALAGWEWDVALLQEVPPWWPAPLACAAGAVERHVLTSRNSLPALRRALAERHADRVRSNGGGANAILVRGLGVDAHNTRRLRVLPERRYLHAVRLAPGGVWVANTHASVRSADVDAIDPELARRVALRWAGRSPLVFGGDLNHRRLRMPGLVHAAGDRIDYVFARGFEPAGPAEVLERGPLSDHAPVLVTLRAAPPGEDARERR